MSSLPPPSTRLPGAPPPPILPPRSYGTPGDPAAYPHLPTPQDEDISKPLENEAPQQEIYRHEPPSPDRQAKDDPPPRFHQLQDGHHEQAPPQFSDRTSRASANDNFQENAREERPTRTAHEERRPKVQPEMKPASWDRPRDTAPPPARKPLTLPASLPPKPVAALGDLDLQQSPSLRTGHHSRGRRHQQQPISEESNNHSTRWGPGPRGDGNRDKERERNRWGGAPEYQGPSLLARMSSNEPSGRELVEIAEREVQKKRARTRKYQGA
jgi:hypothetical protein